jgi:alpha-1,6-mannosyltransferase
VSALVVVWAVALAAEHRWYRDFALHVATVRELMRSPLHQVDPMLGRHHGSPYFSPYTYAVAFFAKVTTLSAVHALAVVAVVNVLLLLWGFRRFVRHVDPRPAAAALGLVAMLLLCGVGPVSWSGFLDARSLSSGIAYPSAMGVALMFHIWALVLDFVETRQRGRLIGAVALTALLALVHPFTAVNAVLGLVAIAVATWRRWRPADWAVAAVLAVVGGVVVLAWELSRFGVGTSALSGLSAIHRPLIEAATRDAGFSSYGLALAGIPALVARARRRRLDLLVVMFVIGAAVFLLAWASGQYGLARVVPLMMLPPQLALGSALARTRWRRAPQAALAGVAIVALGVGGWGVAQAVTRLLPVSTQAHLAQRLQVRDQYARYRFAAGHITPGTTVLADALWGDEWLNYRGAFTVTPGWPDPWAGHVGARYRASATFFAPSTDPAIRARIAQRYGVDCVLLAHHPRLATKPGAVPGFRHVVTGASGVSLLCRPGIG